MEWRTKYDREEVQYMTIWQSLPLQEGHCFHLNRCRSGELILLFITIIRTRNFNLATCWNYNYINVKEIFIYCFIIFASSVRFNYNGLYIGITVVCVMLASFFCYNNLNKLISNDPIFDLIEIRCSQNQ